MDDSPTLSAIASTYLGQKEKPGNSGFSDPAFEAEMKSVGWKSGLSWCAFFVRLCVRKAKVKDMTSSMAVGTFNAYRKAGLTGQEPRIDSLAVWCHWENGKPTPQGHIGIVCHYAQGSPTFDSIEGNTNQAGSRNGDGVYRKIRALSFAPKHDGLVLLGFCYPPKEA